MKKFIKNFKDIILSNEVRILPSSLAYSFFLALIPILSLIFYVITRFNLPNNIIQNFLSTTFPQSVVDLLKPVFENQITLDSLIPMCLGVIVAMNGCNSIIVVSNTIYKVNNASFFRRCIKSLLIVIMLIILFAFIFVVPLFGRTILNLVGSVTSFIADNSKYINRLYFILQVPVSLIIMFYIIKVLFILAPDDKIPSKYVNKGAIFTTISWLLATLVFSYYINNIAKYDAVYGNLANIVILLFYFYVLAYIFIVGICLNKRNVDKGIEKTNTIKLEEIRKQIEKNK